MKKTLFLSRILRSHFFLGYLPLALLLLSLTSCNAAPDAAHPEVPPPPPPVKVKIAQPLSEQVTEWDEYTGRIEAIETVEVRARVSGYLEKVYFHAGAKVKKGDLLFVIDPKPLKTLLNYAQAELAKAQSQQALAKNDLARATRLFKEKAIAAEEYDARQKGLQTATAAVESAKAQVSTAQLNWEFTQIRAPINGHISKSLITQGNLVNGSGADATRLATIVSTNPVHVYVDVDERTLLKYRRQAAERGNLNGTPVELALADETDFPHLGQLDYVAPTENPATGTVSVRGLFANSDDLLSPGFFVRMRIRDNHSYPGLLVPDRALLTDQANRFVWVMKGNNQVEYRKVTPGKKMAEWRVIKEGLQANDWVVIEGVQKLKPDSQVVPEKTPLISSVGH